MINPANWQEIKLWVVGKSLGVENAWEFAGVFEGEERAVAECRDRNYFIAPVIVNQTLPHERTEWVGLRWPVAERE